MFRALSRMGTLMFAPLMFATVMATAVPAANAVSFTDWTTVSAGYQGTCGIRAGMLFCWGSDINGKVGNGDAGAGDVTSPQQIGSSTRWKTVSVGTYHTCGIRGTGLLFCWGSDSDGQVGNGDAITGDVTSPQRIGSSTNWKMVTVGADYTCGIRGTGKLFCWGYDSSGQVGNGDAFTDDVTSPQRIGSSTNWKTVDAGESHTCGIRGSGKLFCWGSDSDGQVGNGDAIADDVTSPQRIGSSTNWKTISAGEYHTCGNRGTGELFCWGGDYAGELGNGDAITGVVTSPQQQDSSSTDWKRVDAGSFYTCGIRGTGLLFCWGSDGYGQLGNGDAGAGDVTSPQQEEISSTDWTTVSSGDRHTCAIRGTGLLYCWGSDSNGRLGNGDASTSTVTSPQQI